MPTILRILLIAAAAYLALVAFLWLIQGRLIHLPDVPSRTLEGTPADVGLAFDEVHIDTADGERLHGWFVPAAEPRGVMLFFHGNAGNISHRLDSLALFHQLDLSVLIIDYRGYGRSTGRSGEVGLYRDAEAALAYLREARGVDAGELVVAGGCVQAPVLVVHDRGDEIVPFSHGRRIFEAAPEPKAFLELEGNHNSGFLVSRERYLEGLRGFLEKHL